jgi:hypothetical protein
MATNHTYLAHLAKVIEDYKRANDGMAVARNVFLRDLLVSEPDRQWFTSFFRKSPNLLWLENTCLIKVASEGKNRQLLLTRHSVIRMKNLDTLVSLHDPYPLLPPHPHDLRPPQQPVAAAANANANANADDDDDDDDDEVNQHYHHIIAFLLSYTQWYRYYLPLPALLTCSFRLYSSFLSSFAPPSTLYCFYRAGRRQRLFHTYR